MENNKKPDRQIVILMGESGAGKTTYLQDHAKEFEGHNIVSRDMVAHEICILKEKETGNHYFINDVYRNIEKDVLEQKTREKFAKAVNNGDNIVVEASSLNSKLRT
ncbi:MAG: AAA family ATPase [Rickettsiales bacterium]